MNKNKQQETFTQIKDWYWQCGLDIYEVNIISRIASWQRANKEFFESKDSISKLFNCDRKTIIRKFEKLERLGIIIKSGKKGRSYIYKINEMNLHKLYNSTSEVQIDEALVPERYNNCTREVHYNTTQTSNKTSLREEETLFERSSSKDPKEPKKTVTDKDVEMLALTLDLE